MTAAELDPYLVPRTQVLRNKLGLTDEIALRQYDYEASAARAMELRERPIAGRFDLDHLKAIHRHLFQDVYEWAGQPRTTGLSKGGSSFVRVELIDAVGAKLAQRLEADGYLRGLDKGMFTKKLTEHFAAWNSMHAFREGNGRATREFFGELARGAGYVIDFRRIDNSRDQWNQASRRAHAGDLIGLEEILRAAVRPARAIAFEVLPRDQAVARHPELQGSYDRMDAASATLTRQYPGNDKAVDHFMGQAKTEAVRLLDTGKVHAARGVERGSRVPEQPSVSFAR